MFSFPSLDEVPYVKFFFNTYDCFMKLNNYWDSKNRLLCYILHVGNILTFRLYIVLDHMVST